VHPSVLAAIGAVNDGHALAYGHDPYTHEIERRVAAQFGERAQAFFVFNGSAANVLSLRAACRPWQGRSASKARTSTSMSAARPSRLRASSC